MPRNPRLKLSWSGFLGVATSALGVLAHPTVTGLLSAKIAVGVSVAGIVIQAFTNKAVQKAEP